MIVVVIVVTVVVLALWLAWNYRNLVGLSKSVDDSWARIDNALKQRHEMVPRLLEQLTSELKGGVEPAEKLRQALSKAADLRSGSPADRLAAESELSEALGLFFHHVEQNAELLDRESYQKLRDDVVRIEDEITVEKSKYNGLVVRYNVQHTVFPTSFLAARTGLKPAFEFEIEEAFARYPLKFKATMPTFVRGRRRIAGEQTEGEEQHDSKTT
ncbi:MAG TPA: LemA family protein [Candidatus Obscuribacterales bacterium]